MLWRTEDVRVGIERPCVRFEPAREEGVEAPVMVYRELRLCGDNAVFGDEFVDFSRLMGRS